MHHVEYSDSWYAHYPTAKPVEVGGPLSPGCIFHRRTAFFFGMIVAVLKRRREISPLKFTSDFFFYTLSVPYFSAQPKISPETLLGN